MTRDRAGRRTVLLVIGTALACAGATVRQSPRAEVWGFTGPWDARSGASAARHGDALDVVVSGWIGLDTAAMPFTRYADSLVASRGGARSMAIVTSEQDERFRPELIRALARDDTKLATASGVIARLLAGHRYRGVILDFEDHTPADLPLLIRVASSIADSARARGVREIGMAIPAGDTAAYPAARLLSAVDFVVVMLYDQHWSRARPGPIADPDWVRRWLAVRVAEGGAARVVAGLPVYGYQWSPDSTKAASTVSFDDARRISAQTGIRLVRDSASATLHAASAGKWDIWIPDAVLLERLVHAARDLGVHRIALWRLGLEDDGIWTGILRRTSPPR